LAGVLATGRRAPRKLPDATGLELIAQEVRERLGDEAVVGTDFSHEIATLEVAPDQIHAVLEHLAGAGEPWEHLMSVHANDYLPDEPRFGIHYELLSMERADRLHVKTRLRLGENVATVVDLFPTAEFQEREIYDMFGVFFDGHPDMRRILMPEDYEGHPQRRDFPMGGEPVIFTFNEHKMPRWYE
jgi:NADH-quinone oxidoreductase subunit C